MMNPKLSLIIPVYNAEDFIYESLISLSKWRSELTYSVQILLIDDGSTDTSLEIMNDYIEKQDDTLQVLSYKSNQGKGYAVKKGMLEAIGDYRIFTDCDIPYGLEVIDKILYYLDFKEFDVCIGNRKSAKSRYEQEITKSRKLSSKIFTFIISRYVVTGVKDTQCGLKGYRANIAKKLFSRTQIKGFAFDVETLYYCYKFDYEIKRIPVSFQGNSISTINLFPVSLQMCWDIILLPIRYHFLNRNHK